MAPEQPKNVQLNADTEADDGGIMSAGLVAPKACCWKHVWFIPGCWRCEAREWRREKEARN